MFQLTAILFEGEHRSSRPLLSAAWLIVTLTWFLCWLAAVVPFSLWRGFLARQARPILGISLVATGVAIFAGRVVELLWRPLAASTFWIVERLLSLFYTDVTSQSSDLVIGTSRFTIEIAPACSGYEGIGLVLAFLSFFFWCFRRDLRFPQVLLLLPAAIVVIWLTNAARVAALIAVGTSVSLDIALGGFHSQVGWLAFNAVALAFVAVAWHVPWFRSESRQPSSVASVVNPTAPYLLPFLALIAAAMITGALSDGFDRLYGLRVIAAGAALCCFARHYRQQGVLNWTFSLAPIAIGAVVFGIWMAAERFFGAAPGLQTTMAEALSSMPEVAVYGWVIFRAIGSICIVPLVEELAFRGYLTRRLVNADFESVPLAHFSWFALLVSSAVFGLMHGRWLAGTVAGVLFALAMYRRGQLMDAVVAHAVANGLITAYVLTTGNWAVWS